MTPFFIHQHHFDSFFASINPDYNCFDVTRLPGAVWPNLYMVQVAGRALVVTLVGEEIRRIFARDLRGTDLRSVTHGPNAESVSKGYDQAIDEQKRVLMRRVVHFKDREITRIVECGFAPLVKDGTVVRIIGCLFAYAVVFGHAEYETDDFQMMEV